MAQVTIYVDEKTLRRIQTAAHQEHDSVSKWVKKRIIHSLGKKWPEGFFDLFGALSGEASFEPPAELDWGLDRKRPAV